MRKTLMKLTDDERFLFNPLSFFTLYSLKFSKTQEITKLIVAFVMLSSRILLAIYYKLCIWFMSYNTATWQDKCDKNK